MYLLTPSAVTTVPNNDDKVFYIKEEDLKALMLDEDLRTSFLKKLRRSQACVAPISETDIKGVVNRYDRSFSNMKAPINMILPKMNYWGV